MSQFKTEWMTGIFVDPGNVRRLLLANIENLRPIRIDKSQDAVLLSVTKSGDTSTPLLLTANQKNALASVIFDDADAWLKSCLLYTSPSPRDATLSRMPSSA